MNSNKFLPPLVCGFGAAVLSTVPGIKELGCCLIVPLAAFLSLFLYQKVTGFFTVISANLAVKFGVLTGFFSAVFATVFEVIITYVAKTNDFVAALPQSEAMLRNWNLGPLMDQTMAYFHLISNQITTTGFSALYTLAIFFSNIIVYIIFGLLGGLLGMSIINKRHSKF